MTTPTSSKLVDILLVEDSPTDRLLTQHALSKARLIHRLHVVDDGVKAMAFLRRQEPFEDAPRPQLILLDLNMPRKNGREVLAEIKADDDLKVIPVIVLTSSRAEDDIMKCYQLHANAYLTKPAGFEAFAEAVAAIENFWFAVATLPPR